MDELDKKLFNDLSEKVEIPVKCEYVIKNAFNNNAKKSKNSIRQILSSIIKTSAVLLLSTGTVFATTKIAEKIWKNPEKVEEFYGANGERIENEEYEIWHSKNINTNNYENIISEKDAEAQINQILKKFGYENEKIQSIELIDNPSDTSLFYRATTENKFLIDLDAKDSKNFKIFTDAAYKNIDNYRGTEEQIKNLASEICLKYGYDTSKYSHIDIKYNSENSADANIWSVKYNKEYDGIVNIYEEITIGIIPEVNELYYFIFTDKAPENTDIMINEPTAKEIALDKEKKLNIGYTIKNVTTNLDIVKMNGYEYLRENDFEHYYKARTEPLYPVEKLEYYRVEERVRKVWKVKLEFEKSKNLPYEEDAFTYFIDATTCEIVGGE